MNEVECYKCGSKGTGDLYMNGDQEYMRISWTCDCHTKKEDDKSEEE